MVLSVSGIAFLIIALLLVIDALISFIFRRWMINSIKWLLRKPARLRILAVIELILGIVLGTIAYSILN